MKNDPIPKAISNLGVIRLFKHDDREYRLACLLRDGDTRPLTAPWWKGKEVSIIAADLDGNFFLRYSDGSVRHWDHSSQEVVTVASSVRDFVTRLELDDEI